MFKAYPGIQLFGSRLIGMAPLFESGIMQVQSLPSEFCFSNSSNDDAPVAQLAEAASSNLVCYWFKSSQEYQFFN